MKVSWIEKQDGGTKDYIMDTCANLLVMAASQKALGTKRFEKSNLLKIKQLLKKYDSGDRYYDEEIRINCYNRFKNKILPFMIEAIKHSAFCGHLTPELWTPILELFFEKAKNYISLGPGA